MLLMLLGRFWLSMQLVKFWCCCTAVGMRYPIGWIGDKTNRSLATNISNTFSSGSCCGTCLALCLCRNPGYFLLRGNLLVAVLSGLIRVELLAV